MALIRAESSMPRRDQRGNGTMRTRSAGLIRGGAFAIAVGAIFFVIAMIWLAPASNDPVEVMRIAGQASGVAVGIGLVMLLFGIIGKKQA